MGIQYLWVFVNVTDMVGRDNMFSKMALTVERDVEMLQHTV